MAGLCVSVLQGCFDLTVAQSAWDCAWIWARSRGTDTALFCRVTRHAGGEKLKRKPDTVTVLL